MNQSHIDVRIIRAEGYLWYYDHLGDCFSVEPPVDENQFYYDLKGDTKRIIFKSDCKEINNK